MLKIEPPVREVLNTNPVINKEIFNMFTDLPKDVGCSVQENNRKSLYFNESDIPGILNSIYSFLQDSEEPNDPTVSELYLKGLMPTEIGSRIASDLRLWRNVKSLYYITPRRSAAQIFDTQIIPVNYY